MQATMLFLSYQVYTGVHQSEIHRISSVESTASLKVGALVAVHCENYSDCPAIGRCSEVSSGTIKIDWLKGTYTSSWKPWMVMVAGRRRRKEQWSDWVPKDSIILFDFELTATNRLRKTTAEHLKRKYIALTT